MPEPAPDLCRPAAAEALARFRARTLSPVGRRAAAIGRAEGRPSPTGSIERHAFHARTGRANAVVQTGERRFHGCLVPKEGVIPPDA